MNGDVTLHQDGNIILLIVAYMIDGYLDRYWNIAGICINIYTHICVYIYILDSIKYIVLYTFIHCIIFYYIKYIYIYTYCEKIKCYKTIWQSMGFFEKWSTGWYPVVIWLQKLSWHTESASYHFSRRFFDHGTFLVKIRPKISWFVVLSVKKLF